MTKKRGPKPTTRAPAKETLTRHLLKILAGIVILALLVAAIGATALFLFPPDAEEVSTVTPREQSQPPVYEIFPPREKSVPIHPEITLPPVPRHVKDKPRLAIIIDDLGYDKWIADRFLQLKSPLTFSVLPCSPHGKTIAAAAHAQGNEVMLHLPMEPREYPQVDPGPGVLLTGMSPDQLINRLKKNLADIPHVSGVNNHMGSKMTSVSAQMYQILSILKKEHLFFIDSRTTNDSLCRPSAKLLQVPFAERDVFLDNSLEEKAIRHQLILLIKKAKERGTAIGIGHPHDVTYRILEEMLPEITKRVHLVPASHLVKIVDS